MPSSDFCMTSLAKRVLCISVWETDCQGSWGFTGNLIVILKSTLKVCAELDDFITAFKKLDAQVSFPPSTVKYQSY